MLRSNDRAVLKSAAEFFQLNKKSLGLETQLLKYLRGLKNGYYPEGTNALVALYFSLKHFRPREIESTVNLKTNVFQGCHVRMDEDQALNEFNESARQYVNLIVEEPTLGALFPYFFFADSEIKLQDYTMGISFFAPRSLFLFINLCLLDNYDPIYRNFKNKNMIVVIWGKLSD